MNLSDLEAISRAQRETLEANGWTVADIATAQVKQLTGLKGIGPKTAEKAIEEAKIIVNAQGLEEAEKLALERYYQKTPPWKVVLDWEEAGLSIQDVALSSINALAILKGIDEGLADRCIQAARTTLNERKLAEGKYTILEGGGASKRPVSAAFPEEWLSGAVTPPPMGVRQQRIFEQAKREYEAASG